MLCYSELQELVGYGVLVAQRVTVDGIGDILRFQQRSCLSFPAGARKRRGSWGWGDGFDKKTRSSVKAGGGYEYDAPSGSSDRMQRVVYRSISRSRVDGDDIITFTWPSDFSEAPTGRQRDGEMVKVEGPARARAIGLVQNRRRRHYTTDHGPRVRWPCAGSLDCRRAIHVFDSIFFNGEAVRQCVKRRSSVFHNKYLHNVFRLSIILARGATVASTDAIQRRRRRSNGRWRWGMR
jgi:hypothetical protein